MNATQRGAERLTLIVAIIFVVATFLGGVRSSFAAGTYEYTGGGSSPVEIKVTSTGAFPSDGVEFDLALYTGWGSTYGYRLAETKITIFEDAEGSKTGTAELFVCHETGAPDNPGHPVKATPVDSSWTTPGHRGGFVPSIHSATAYLFTDDKCLPPVVSKPSPPSTIVEEIESGNRYGWHSATFDGYIHSPTFPTPGTASTKALSSTITISERNGSSINNRVLFCRYGQRWDDGSISVLRGEFQVFLPRKAEYTWRDIFDRTSSWVGADFNAASRKDGDVDITAGGLQPLSCTLIADGAFKVVIKSVVVDKVTKVNRWDDHRPSQGYWK